MKKRFLSVSRKVMAMVMAAALVVPTVVMNPMEAKAIKVNGFKNEIGFAGNAGQHMAYGDNFSMEFNFHTKTDIVATNYDTFGLDITNTMAVGKDNNGNDDPNEWGFLSLRADNWGWWNGDWNGTENAEKIVKTSDVNWNKWKETIADADVNIVIDRSGDVLTVTMNIYGKNGEEDWVTYTVENAYGYGNVLQITLTSMQAEPAVVTVSDVEVEKTENVVNTAGFATKPGTVSFDGNFDATYTFETNSSAITKNWDTFAIELTDGTDYVDLRADLYGWRETADNDDLTSGNWNTNINWDTYASIIADASVVVRVSRIASKFNVQINVNGANGQSFASSLVFEDADMAEQVKVCITSAQEASTVTLSNVNVQENAVQTIGAQTNDTDLGFVTTISKADFEAMDIKAMGVLVKNSANATEDEMTLANVGTKIKNIPTSYVTDINNLDNSMDDANTYAFRSIIKGVTNEEKEYTAVPYITYMDGEEEVTVYGAAITRSIAEINA